MSETPPTANDREQAIVERALERLSAADPLAPRGRPAAEPQGEEETLLRLHTETLGALPYALAPLAPPAGLKGRLLAAVAGDETQEVSGLARRATTPLPGTLRGPAVAAAVVERRPARWPLALAAALALALLGATLWLYGQTQTQRFQIARLEAEMNRLSAAVGDAESVRANMALVTSPGVAACALRPASASSAAASGALFVAADHQHWYLVLRGLAPCPQGRRYQVWFHTDGAAVSAGTFDPLPGEVTELRSATMPAGTRAVSVTLEPEAGAAAPSGPRILVGEELARVL